MYKSFFLKIVLNFIIKIFCDEMYCYYFKEARGKTIDMSTSAIRSAKAAENGSSNGESNNLSGGSASSAKENQTTNVAPAAPKKDKPVRQRTALYSENLPTFYVGAGNNSEL